MYRTHYIGYKENGLIFECWINKYESIDFFKAKPKEEKLLKKVNALNEKKEKKIISFLTKKPFINWELIQEE